MCYIILMNLPMVLIDEIFSYLGPQCSVCNKKLNPWTMIGYPSVYLCDEKCFKQTCIHQ